MSMCVIMCVSMCICLSVSPILSFLSVCTSHVCMHAHTCVCVCVVVDQREAANT